MMDFKYVFLWTDFFIYILVAVVGLYVYRSIRTVHLRAPWRKVARRPAAMASAVVLIVYVMIGLLDSFHMRLPVDGSPSGGVQQYSPEVVSLFDRIAEPLRKQVEKTYSAPFSTHLYSVEMMEMPDGSQVRGYPRLKYGGAHLGANTQNRIHDIEGIALKGFVDGLLVWLSGAILLLAGIAFVRKEKCLTTFQNVFRGQGEVPWRTILLTAGILSVVIAMAIPLSLQYHILGTNKVGIDVFYLSLKSIRTGLAIGTLTTLVMLPFALALGIMAGYFRGIVDDVIQYIYTTLSSIPDVLLIAAAVLMMQVYMDSHPDMFETIAARADLRLLFLCMILGITSWTGLCRLLRGETLKLREADYIQAAQSFGVGQAKIMARHILPNVMHIVLITVTLQFSTLVLAEAVLAYVGVGVDPTMPSWGNMINSARLELAREPVVWWSLASAFGFMFLLVLAANLFADAVRDAFDPRTL